jgi:predicted ATPase
MKLFGNRRHNSREWCMSIFQSPRIDIVVFRELFTLTNTYKRVIDSGKLEHDHAQFKLIRRLERIEAHIIEFAKLKAAASAREIQTFLKVSLPSENRAGNDQPTTASDTTISDKDTVPQPTQVFLQRPRGCYIWGEVGTGVFICRSLL